MQLDFNTPGQRIFIRMKYYEVSLHHYFLFKISLAATLSTDYNFHVENIVVTSRHDLILDYEWSNVFVASVVSNSLMDHLMDGSCLSW